MPPRIPSPSDFSAFPSLQIHAPDPPESTTTLLLILHGLGDNPLSFSAFPRSLNLPSTYCLTIRGVSPLPPSLLPDPAPANGCFHWGDDLTLNSQTGELDTDPGFTKARKLILDDLIQGVIIDKLGWEHSDIIIFGFGQGGSLALGLASSLRQPQQSQRIEEITEEDNNTEGKNKEFKGVISIGGALPHSMIPTISNRQKVTTPALVMCGRESEAIAEDAEDTLKEEFQNVQIVRWKGRRDDGMPRNREEVLPMMEFFAERLRQL
ncbi:Alpha/Beta hydrolase protein [Apiosordaria backusii]|uniref:Alpha/Beta hydrolase protein n=1 Tax=Apiosordaria backusii TaxID=314023 RepID=A0AA40ED25_9PEZI|nr:Alpha/Beta hydrolase protein [Apiosordaria backusii]